MRANAGHDHRPLWRLHPVLVLGALAASPALGTAQGRTAVPPVAVSVPAAAGAPAPATPTQTSPTSASSASASAPGSVSTPADAAKRPTAVTLDALSSLKMLEQLRELQAKVLALNPPPPAPPPKPSTAASAPPATDLLALQRPANLPAPVPLPPALSRIAAIYGPTHGLQAEIVDPKGAVHVVRAGSVVGSVRVLGITAERVEVEIRQPVIVPGRASGAAEMAAASSTKTPVRKVQTRPGSAASQGPVHAQAAGNPSAATPRATEVLVLSLRVGSTFETP
jgi:hypothetical protein